MYVIKKYYIEYNMNWLEKIVPTAWSNIDEAWLPQLNLPLALEDIRTDWQLENSS